MKRMKEVRGCTHVHTHTHTHHEVCTRGRLETVMLKGDTLWLPLKGRGEAEQWHGQGQREN